MLTWAFILLTLHFVNTMRRNFENGSGAEFFFFVVAGMIIYVLPILAVARAIGWVNFG